MALQIRRAHRFFYSPQDLIALRTSDRANRKMVPCRFPVPIYRTPSLFLVGASTSALLALVVSAGCTDLRYGQVDCAVLQGEAARMCQEYRQKKADADIRAEQAELLQAYNYCRKKYDNDPEQTVNNCSIYEKPLRSIGSLPK